jgi:hypothetical protein
VNVLFEILPGLALTLATGTVIFILIYLTSPRSRPEFVFTYMVFSMMAFLVTSLLRDVQLTLGFSFGLLAVFTLLRYRTDVIPIREMTFLYVAITVPFMNSLFMATRVEFNELVLLNGGIAAFIFIVDRALRSYYGLSQVIFYEKIDLIRTENTEALLADLHERLGVEVKSYVVEEVDFLRDTARLTVYYRYDGRRRGARG